MAKYSPHRLPCHSPTASTSSMRAYTASPDGQEGERALGEHEGVLDHPEQPGAADVEPKVPVQGSDGRQGILVRPLDPGPVVLEPPYPVGRGPDDQEPEKPLHSE